MKKLMLSIAIASALGVSGCGGDSIADIKDDVISNGEAQLPLSRISYNPGDSEVPVPNDLLFSGTTDGTLNIPDEASAIALNETPDYFDPSIALGALDGWSPIAPMSIPVDMAQGVSLDATTVSQPGAVRVFEAVVGGPLSGDAECTTEASVTACKMGDELTFGVDFVTTVSGDSIVMVPIKPFKAKQSYVVAVTNLIEDSNGNSIAPSTTYESVRLDVDSLPLPLDSQLQLQTIINSYEDRLNESGVDTDSVVYSALFTTQSTEDVLATAKISMLVNSPVLTPFTASGFNVGQALASTGTIDVTTDAGLAAFTSASRADVYSSTLNTAHYLDIPTAENCVLTTESPSPTTENCPSLFSYFTAMGDSPITVLGALSSGVLSGEAFSAQYAAQAPLFGRSDVFDGNAANLVGLNFTIDVVVGADDNGDPITQSFPLDNAKHLTKFNPLPQVKSIAQIPVLITVPNTGTMPADGWPVMIYQHGITTVKETLFAFAGAMADAGFVVVAIDHPLHGERFGELTADNGLVVPISSSDTAITNPFDPSGDDLVIDGNPTAYLNLASLLTARDNVRQSELDMLALRLSLNAMASDPTINIDVSNVNFYGHSLGGLTGVTFVAEANQPTINPLTGTVFDTNPYQIKAASFLAPGGGIPGFLLESPSFSGLVKSGLITSDAFQTSLIEAAATQGITEAQLAELQLGDPEQYNTLVDATFEVFSAQFNFAAQTIMDSGDPINYASTIASNTNSIHLMEIVGDGANNLPDQVIPNTTVGSALAGTEPLATNMELDPISDTTVNGDGITGLVRFTDGHHGSILTPSLENGGSTEAGNTAVLVEMQTQLATFMASGGTTILISDDSVVK